MEFYASIYGITGKSAPSLCLELLDLVNLSDKINLYVDDLSRGWSKGFALPGAWSITHSFNPWRTGIWPGPKGTFWNEGNLKNLIDMDKTIIISSHILPELARNVYKYRCYTIRANGFVRSGWWNIIHDVLGKPTCHYYGRLGKSRPSPFLKEQPLCGNAVL